MLEPTGFGEMIPVRAPEYLVSPQRIPVFAPTYKLFTSATFQIPVNNNNREFKIRRLRTTATDKYATAHDQNHVTVHFSRVALWLR